MREEIIKSAYPIGTNMAIPRSRTAQRARDTVNNAAATARQTIDRADRATVEAKHRAHVTKARTQYKVNDLSDKAQKAATDTTEWVKKNPGKAIVGAAAIGWLAAKLFGPRR